MQESWHHDYCDLGGVRLHYVEQGKGQLILLLHGFPEFWYSWRHQIPALAAHFRVVAPDLRGYNLSDKPARIGDYRLKRLTDDVLGLVHAFGEKKAIIVGHDWGGALAWSFAAWHAELTERLIVLNSPHPDAYAKHIRSNLRQLARSWYALFFQIPWLPEWLIRTNRRFFVHRAFRGTAIHKNAFSDADLQCFAEALNKPGAARAAINYYRATFREWARGGARPLPPIACPTMLIWGEEDIALGKELTYCMEPYFKNGFKLRYISHCSHWVQQDCPDVVNRWILEFLLEADGPESRA